VSAAFSDTSPETPLAQWKGCSAANFRAGRPTSFEPTAIVIHISEGCLSSADSWFNNPDAQVSAHYIVAKSGEIHQYVKERDTAFHAGAPLNPTWKLLRPKVNANWYTIGIEHEGKVEDAWPEAQYHASAQLISDIARRWSIPVDADHLVLHREIHGDRSCPGFVFDRAKLLSLIATLAQPPATPT
jgi:N-acetyl-anhydromuramyl-L-alanine amidase AmpD